MNPQFDSKIKKYSPEMYNAITDTEGIVRVIAGAGTGKTTALQNRIIYLCESGKAKGEDILCVSFTNKAVQEIKKRIPKGFYDRPLYCPFVSTFHGFAAFYLHRGNMRQFNFPDNFDILGDMEHEAAFSLIMEELQLPEKKFDRQELQLMIEKRKLSDYRQYIELLKDRSGCLINAKIEGAASQEESIFYRYLSIQRRNNVLDFNDLLCFMLYLLEEDSCLREELQKKYSYILIDEFQDISSIEFSIMRILAEVHHNFFCVGDPDQCIYSFRGSKIDFITELDKYFPNIPVKTIVLAENHRSTKNILSVANAIIAKNKNRYPKELFSHNDTGNFIYAIWNVYIQAEAEYIANDIKQAHQMENALNKFCSKRNRSSFQNTAILVRTSWQLGYLKEALDTKDIIYSDGTIPLLECKEIKDLIAWMKFLLFHDDLSLKRIINRPNRGIGRAHWRKITSYAQQQHCLYYIALCDLIDRDRDFQHPEILKFKQISEQLSIEIMEKLPIQAFQSIIQSVYAHTDFASGWDVESFLNVIRSWHFQSSGQLGERPVMAFLKDLTMKPESIFHEKNNCAIQLLTVHRAKGLEFSTVYIAGLNSGIFPSSRADSLELQEEERRLMYVACTRAKSSLILSAFIKAGKDYPPSKYLYDLAEVPCVLFNDSRCKYSINSHDDSE